MATSSIKSLLLTLSVAGAVLPGTAMAGPAATPANAPVEMWDVVTPRAETKTSVSHIDVQPGQGFDAPGTIIPMTIQIVTRADFEGAAHVTDMWDTVPADTQPKAFVVSHMDIQPGQSFDYPAMSAPKNTPIVQSASVAQFTTPDT